MVNNIPVNGWPQLKDLEAVQPTLDRLDKIEAWKRTVKEETFTGDDITIDNALALPARSLITEIAAIQDLHGYDHPWAGGAGKNKLAMTVDNIKSWNGGASSWNGNSKVISGVTWTIVTDNDENVTGIKANDTASATSLLQISDTMSFTEGDKINGASGGSSDTYGIGASGVGMVQTNDDYTVTAAFASVDKYLYCRVNNGVTVSNKMFYPMLRNPSESATFAPYSNECPISGRTQMVVNVSGHNMWDEQWEVGGINSTTGQPETASDRIRSKNYIPISGNTDYFAKISGNNVALYIYYYDENYNHITSSSLSHTTFDYKSNQTTHSPANARYMKFNTNGAYGNAYHNNIGINYPNSLTDYVPYVSNKNYIIQLGQTVYGADINWDTGAATVTHKRIAPSAVLSGFMGRSNYIGVVATDAIPCTSAQLSNAISDRFVAITGDAQYTQNLSGIAQSLANPTDTSSRVLITVSGITSVADLNTWLAENTPQICYKLATPTTIQLTPTEVQMLKGYNRVTLSDGYGTIELKALTGANWS